MFDKRSTVQFLLLLLLLVVPGSAVKAADGMSKAQQNRLEVDVALQEGLTAHAKIADLAAVRQKDNNDTLIACGLTLRLGVALPFMARFLSNSQTWRVYVAKNGGDDAYRVLASCTNAGAVMETWVRIMTPKDVSGVRGGNYKPTAVERDVISRDLGKTLRLGKAARIVTIRGFQNPNRVKHICGYAKMGSRLVPFAGIYKASSTSDTARFEVKQFGIQEIWIWRVHNRCEEYGIDLS